MKDEARKAIPLPVARQLRQEAGFGCCKCGLPIVQYHHIVQWGEEQHYRAEDMMALCPNHHDQVTKGAMPEAEQRALKSSPFNILKGRAAGLLEIKQDYCAADFGTVTVVGEGTFLSIDEQPLLAFHMGEKNLEVSLRLFSEKNELLVEIVRNEWISGDPLPWDIEADWQTLTLREKARKISITVNAKTIPMQITGEFWRSGRRFICDKTGVAMQGSGKISFRDVALVGARLELSTSSATFGASPEEGGWMLISWPNHRERLWKARDAWRSIVKKRTLANAVAGGEANSVAPVVS